MMIDGVDVLNASASAPTRWPQRRADWPTQRDTCSACAGRLYPGDSIQVVTIVFLDSQARKVEAQSVHEQRLAEIRRRYEAKEKI